MTSLCVRNDPFEVKDGPLGRKGCVTPGRVGDRHVWRLHIWRYDSRPELQVGVEDLRVQKRNRVVPEDIGYKYYLSNFI